MSVYYLFDVFLNILCRYWHHKPKGDNPSLGQSDRGAFTQCHQWVDFSLVSTTVWYFSLFSDSSKLWWCFYSSPHMLWCHKWFWLWRKHAYNCKSKVSVDLKTLNVFFSSKCTKVYEMFTYGAESLIELKRASTLQIKQVKNLLAV